MALKTLMLRKKIDTRKKEYEALLAKDSEFEARNAELEKAIEEAETEDEQETVREAVEGFEAEKSEHEKTKTDLEKEIRELEAEMEELEKKMEDPAPAPAPAPADPEERKEKKEMKTRKFFGMNEREMNEFITREDVKNSLENVRTCIREKRAVTNVGLTIPTVMLGLIRENILEYSKLYKYVALRQVNGEGRAVIMGTIPEAVWTECCANLNELDLTFADVELNCWKVAGYFAVCNANIEDSDIDLAAEILTALGQAIGLALDKAILYGTGTRMPLGVVTRLVQTQAPADYPATARTWANLSATNVVALGDVTGTALVKAIVESFGAAKGKYSRGEKVFVMNEATYTKLAASTIATTAEGLIVAGVTDRMPVIGGIIEVLDFIPDNVIIGGYFDLYILAERAGTRFATSEHVRFLNDQTIFRGIARYDGQPAIAEGFVAMAIGTTKPTAAMTFAPDTANQGE